MTYSKQLLEDIAQGLKNCERDILFFLDIRADKVIRTTEQLASPLASKSTLIPIEPLWKDLLELMEDFALEQETEEIQEHLLSTLKKKELNKSIMYFYQALLDYPRSKKSWYRIEEKWLQERAEEFLEDYKKITRS